MITLARVESELDYWFSGEPPTCSVLWLIGGTESLASALAEHAARAEPRPACRAAACSPKARPRPFATVSGSDQLLQAKLDFSGSALHDASSPIIRHASSGGSVGEVVSVDLSRSDEIWPLLAGSSGLRMCAGLFAADVAVPDEWTYSALRLVMNAGTSLLNRGAASGARDALLHAFLADTLQAGGVAVIKGGLELCGPGVALTGSPDTIDRAERVFADSPRADNLQVRHSLELAGPWSVASRSGYQYSVDKRRWVPAKS